MIVSSINLKPAKISTAAIKYLIEIIDAVMVIHTLQTQKAIAQNQSRNCFTKTYRTFPEAGGKFLQLNQKSIHNFASKTITKRPTRLYYLNVCTGCKQTLGSIVV